MQICCMYLVTLLFPNRWYNQSHVISTESHGYEYPGSSDIGKYFHERYIDGDVNVFGMDADIVDTNMLYRRVWALPESMV